MKVLIVCRSCKGTGIYHGFCEKPGEGVVCVKCGGTGSQEEELFVGRRTREDIKILRLSRGVCAFVGTPGNETITYEQFLEGRLPKQ